MIINSATEIIDALFLIDHAPGGAAPRRGTTNTGGTPVRSLATAVAHCATVATG
jgi:hypothetical protein